ncbi:hypothetical protein TRIUR3_14256 [Triticum urartu]|uniref:Uncharacterized protein n=1 Tax=Triticum urartu TaxID=4572 RepID=M7ZPU2_TRIUA|nr:hypothetical protein TRIUR3_14256 [Triticum urartu]
MARSPSLTSAGRPQEITGMQLGIVQNYGNHPNFIFWQSGAANNWEKRHFGGS